MAQVGAEAAQAAANLIEAFNDADWTRLRGVLADDVVYEETGTGRRVEGPDAYIELVQAWREALPDVRGTIQDAIASGDRAAQQVLWEGTHTGPMRTPTGTLEASGARISVDASVWTRFEGDRAKEVRHYLDVFALLQQIGAMPGQT